jgi:hypothetical protein
MSAITILVAATGLVLGLRFNAFVLGLLLLLGVASVLTIGIWSDGNLGVVALHLLATLASVQISYLIGFLIAAQITARTAPTSSPMESRSLRRFSGPTISCADHRYSTNTCPAAFKSSRFCDRRA